MSMSIRKCTNCGAYHIKIVSWIDGLKRSFFFCSPKCKREYMEQKYPEIRRKEVAREEEAKNILPQVRSFVARKTPDGIVTVVRSDGGVHRRTPPTEG